MLTVMIVDDEAPSRDLLRDMLAVHGDVQIVGDYGRSPVALDAIQASPPDLVFLDIQMPGMPGFELLERLPEGRRPAVVFVTAHQDYAHQAFEVEAVDYLLKPFDEQRLERTLDRVRRHFASLGATEALRLSEAAARLGGEGRLERIVVREGERSFFVPVTDLAWLESDGKLVRLHTGGAAHEIRESLTRLDERLDSSRFVRVSRSAIVNIDRIREVQAWFHGDRIIVMDNGDTVTTTRGYRERLLRLLEN
jgi:two-component system, LytTR family, response regulator